MGTESCPEEGAGRGGGGRPPGRLFLTRPQRRPADPRPRACAAGHRQPRAFQSCTGAICSNLDVEVEAWLWEVLWAGGSWARTHALRLRERAVS